MMRFFIAKLLFLFVMMMIIAGCGQGEGNIGSGGLNDESNWEIGQGDLPSSIGDIEKKVDMMDEQAIPPFHSLEYLWDKTPFDEPTGKWFMHNGQGVLGYGLTTGTKKGGDEFAVTFIGHKDEGEPMNRDVRIQLSELDGYDIKEVIVEEIVYIDTVGSNEQIFSGELPHKENVLYMLSAEILNENEEVEDSFISLIFVPKPEMNAALQTDKSLYEQSDNDLTLILQNAGPTVLFYGTYYTIEKKVEDDWRVVPLDMAFHDIGLYSKFGETYEQKVDISQLNAGQYRVIKDISVEGLDITQTLAAEFIIE
ncbi:immunoglobulin-like domain-containing protein [Evansella cellulosilytica]|uniref:Bacterial Ig-like domain-containing protein n=1 Tax=Evansella cellulosilytica (strain ATCC 21833 / DSM 2522 / FERM P-1141 / JCM 9156 / N-4) TaxID=649639 RepID=E6TXG8_EVAC2|nr:immunoglobulin-like domain-containing protein [Evansella cellulosilytica]ADU28782.1 hypothetical protein Bcell_0500 [Evansella cellulosilytica DSM 2522]